MATPGSSLFLLHLLQVLAPQGRADVQSLQGRNPLARPLPGHFHTPWTDLEHPGPHRRMSYECKGDGEGAAGGPTPPHAHSPLTLFTLPMHLSPPWLTCTHPHPVHLPPSALVRGDPGDSRFPALI